jgi:hypothetical protein
VLLGCFWPKENVQKANSGILHLMIYVGFLVINIEGIEFFLDGLTGNHRTIAMLCKSGS